MTASTTQHVADRRAQGLMDNLLIAGALQELPFMQSTVKLARTHAERGDLRFPRRIARFLAHLRDVSDEAGAQFVASLEASKERQRVGETLMILLYRADDIRKADLLGSLTKGYILRRMGWSTFLILSDAIDRCSVDDLPALQRLGTDEVVPGDAGTRLLATGLAEPAGEPATFGRLRPTELGARLVDLVLDRRES